ncbi:MAG: PAS domain S-box protein, partial [SAR324 cluster bacterium]|nr:PAS domain S-box protein [SAR324 cluster bacterium]
QAEGHPGFRFSERERQGRMIRAGSRAEYFPVYYVEPLQGNEAAFGFDLGSNPTRLKALRKARDTGGLVATERITLVQEDQDQFGFLVFLPVYGSGEVPATVAMRRKTLTGFVLGVYRIAGIVRSSLPRHDQRGLGVEIYVFDASAPPGRRLLYPKNASAQSAEELTLPFQIAKTIRVADREWKVVIAPAEGVLSIEHSWQHWAVLAAGFLITFLLTSYQAQGLIRRFQMEEIEASLRKSRNSMLKAQEVAHLGYVEWDLKSRKQVWSDEAFRIFGWKPHEVEPDEKIFADIIHPEDKKFVLSSINRTFEHGEVLESDFRVVTPDGLIRHVNAKIERIMDPTGKPTKLVSTLQDITERKLAELRTETVLDDLARLIDTANAPIFGIDAQGKINEWNQSAAKITGFSKEETMGHDLVAEFISEENQASVKDVLDRALLGEQTENFEFPLYSKQGQRVDVLLNSTTRRDAAGNIVGVVGIGQDITERKIIEADLKESEQRFRDFADSAADFFWELDEELRFTFISPNIEQILDLKPEWHYGKTREEMLGENYDKELWNAHLEDLQAHRPFKDFTYFRVGEDVTPRWLTISGVPIFDTEGRFNGYRGSGSDITERKQAEQNLQESEEQIRLLLDSTAEAIFGIDLKGNCLFLNPSCIKMLGYDHQEDLLGKNMHDLTHHTRADGSPYAKKECQIGKHMWEGKDYHNDDEVFWRADGTSFPVECWMHPIVKNNEVTGAMVTFLDITERKQAQAQVIQASKLATLGEMATSVAHELNQPLNVISMAAGNLMRRQKKGSVTPEYLQQKLTRITSQTERAAAIIDHMRMFGRKASEKPSPLDPREAVQGAMDLMGEQLRLGGIRLETHLAESCAPVLGHRVQMEQVVLNLLANARDAIQSQPVGHAKNISITVESSDNGRISISIRDTGGGIPESLLSRIFEPFFTTKEIGKGTGLGLSVSYGIIHDMGGTIEAENIGDGARFTISLPVHSQA